MNFKHKLETARKIWRTGGRQAIENHLRWKLAQIGEARKYQKWIVRHDALSDADRSSIRRRINNFAVKPLISIVMPVYNVEERWLRSAIESVLKQLYENWEFCIADDCSPQPHVKRVLQEYAARDQRIKTVFRQTNGHISAASNSALELATGEFCALLDHDDELAETALYFVAEEINRHPNVEMIYTDEDVLSPNGRRHSPKFKPDWSPDLFYSLNLVTHLSVYRTDVLRRINGFRIGVEGSQDYDLALRVVEQIPSQNIRHIPHVLYHWRAIPGSVAFAAEEKSYAHERARQAIKQHFDRTSIRAEVVGGFGTLHRAVYRLPEPQPNASIVLIADKFVEQTIRSIRDVTAYESFEIVVVANESQKLANCGGGANARIVECDSESAAAQFNFGAANSDGDVLIFLRSGLLVDNADWLRELTSQACREEVGAVAGKVFYSNKYVKQAGLILGDGSIVNAHRLQPFDGPGHFGRAQVINNFSAISAESFAVRRQTFARCGNFNSRNLPTCYFTVELCLRLREEFGLRTVWTPYARFSQSREFENEQQNRAFDEKCRIELSYLTEKWKAYFENDPFYNPNLNNQSEDFSIQIPPRRELRPFRCE